MTCDHKQGDICLLELFDGKPTDYQCDICPAYSGRMRGVGDAIARGLSKLGLDKLASKSCKCGQRQAKLNKALPTRKP
jgi:hypothetical protein